MFIKNFLSIYTLFSVDHSNIISRRYCSKIKPIEGVLNWTAKDSIILDMINNNIAIIRYIDYGEIILDACFLKFDFESKTVYTKYCQMVIIKNEQTHSFKWFLNNFRFLEINFKTKKNHTVKLGGKLYSRSKRQNNGTFILKMHFILLATLITLIFILN